MYVNGMFVLLVLAGSLAGVSSDGTSTSNLFSMHCEEGTSKLSPGICCSRLDASCCIFIELATFKVLCTRYFHASFH